jgi:hypothetical protein
VVIFLYLQAKQAAQRGDFFYIYRLNKQLNVVIFLYLQAKQAAQRGDFFIFTG